ncbi:MAG: PulJ/GspJ family protein [Kiritimatiellia bacterium]|jgi:hypothetical protein
MNISFKLRCGHDAGFTIPEVLIASAISVSVLLGIVSLLVSTLSSWQGVNLRMDADTEANLAMSRLVYGVGGRLGLRSASALDVLLTNEDDGSWTLNYITGSAVPETNSFSYLAADKRLVFNPGGKTAGEDVSAALVSVASGSLSVALRVEKEKGRAKVQREIGTKLLFRN